MRCTAVTTTMPAKTRATQMLNFMTDAVRSRLTRQTGGVFYHEGVLLVEDDALDLEEIEEGVEVTEESVGVKKSPREKSLRKSGNVSILAVLGCSMLVVAVCASMASAQHSGGRGRLEGVPVREICVGEARRGDVTSCDITCLLSRGYAFLSSAGHSLCQQGLEGVAARKVSQ